MSAVQLKTIAHTHAGEPDGKSRWQDMCVVSKSSYEINITDVDQSMISISDIEHGRDYYAFVTAHNAVGAGERRRSDVKVTALGHPSKPKIASLTIRQGVANIKIAALDDDGGVAATNFTYTYISVPTRLVRSARLQHCTRDQLIPSLKKLK